MIQKQAEIRSPYRGMAELLFPINLYAVGGPHFENQ